MAISVEEKFRELITNKRKFIETLLVVENKQRHVVPFIYNPIQDDADRTSTGHDIWVKPAQVGFSTERIASRLVDTLTNPGTNTVLIAYEDFITQRLLGKVSFFYNHLSNLGIPGFPEIYHDSDFLKSFRFHVDGKLAGISSIYVASARSKTAGRTETIHHLLLDEHAFYIPEATERVIAPAMARIPPEGTVDSFCYDAETEVLTDRGWLRFTNLLTSDKVLTKDEYGNAYYVKPMDYQVFDYNGDMVWFNGKHLDLLVTPNHSVWIRKRWCPNGFIFEEAKDAVNNSRLNFDHSFNWEGEYREWIAIPPYTYKFGHKEHILPEVHIRMDLWLDFVGYFLSEGTLGHNRHGNYDKVTLYQSEPSRCYQEIRHISNVIAGYLGTHCYECTNDNGVTSFTIADVRLGTFLSQYAKPKRIPDDILQLPKRQLEILFNSYMLGDGFAHINGGRLDRCFTVSEPLADGLQELGLKLGYYSGKHYSRHGEHNPGWNVSFVSINGSYPSWSNGRSGEHLQQYKGKVYDVTIPTKNHLLLVRRNGKPIWSGNSTPNGEDNDFHDWYIDAKDGKSVFTAHFYTWFMHPEYTMKLGDPRIKDIPESDKPTFNLNTEEEMLVFNRGLTFDQIRWRRWMSKVMEGLRRFGETRTLFKQEFPEDDVSCFLSTGDMYFDTLTMDTIAKNCYPAPTSKDNLSVWYPPEEGRNYTIAIDPGQAKVTQSAITVITFDQDEQGNYKPRLCARDAGLYSPEITAKKAKAASWYYNKGMIVWEANSHGLAITELLKHYRPIYFRKDIVSGMPSVEPGWLTTSKNKDYMLQLVTRYLPDTICHDIELVRQLRNHRQVGDKIEVIGFDDILMSFAIGLITSNPKPIKRGLIGRSGWRW